MKTKYLLLLLIIISIFSIVPLFHKGFFISDDGEWMIIRFSAFHQALVHGQFPVRFLPRLYFEYGYPVANFLYPGFMYLAEIPKLLKFSFVDSIKIIFGMSMLFSSLFSYFWLSRLFDKTASFFGSLIYLYAPYHLFDLYKRGSVGEILSFAVAPFILWQIEREDVFWASIGIAFLLISHNSLGLLFGLLLMVYLLVNIAASKRKKQRIYTYACMLIFGFGLSCFFWIPAVLDLKYTVFSKTPVSDWSKYFANFQLIGFSALFIFISILVLYIVKKLPRDKHKMTIFFLACGIISLFFATAISSPLWNLLPVSLIQFPFRFLPVTIISVAFLSAVIISEFSEKTKLQVGLVFFIISLMSSKPFLTPSQYVDRVDGFYATNLDSTTVKNEYLPIGVIKPPSGLPSQKAEIKNGVVIASLLSPSSYRFTVNAENKSDLTIHTFYFPGWGVLIDGEKKNILIDEAGQMHIQLPRGNHSVLVYFGETPIRALSDGLSLASLFALIIFQLRYRKLYEK